MSGTSKPVVFLCPGPEYLFYTSGIFYAWELAASYDVVLLLDFPFQKREILERLRDRGTIRDYVSIDAATGTLSLLDKLATHRGYCRISRELFDKYQPVAILQHSDIPPLNIYFSEDAVAREVPRITYKASVVLSDENMDIGVLHLLQREKLARRYNLPDWAAGVCYEAKVRAGYCLNYWLLPYVNKGCIFRPRLRLLRRKGRWLNSSRNYFDYSLTHTEKECRLLREAAGQECVVVRFPMTRVGSDVFHFLYGSAEEQRTVLILPTNGEVEYLMRSLKLSRAMANDRYFQNWLEAIRILAEKFPAHAVAVKCKSQKDGELFRYYLDRSPLAGRVAIFPSTEDTNALILRSDVIVSTVSTVLWWAHFLPSSKCLISLDLWGYPCGDYYADFDGILYFDSTESLRDRSRWESGVQREKDLPAMTLTQFMEANVGRREK